MKLLLWPDGVKLTVDGLQIVAHSVGGAGLGGHAAFKAGPGARWAGSVSVHALCPLTACALRAMFNGLRGKSGTFTMELPEAGVSIGSVCPSSNGLTQFSDCTTFSDGTRFSDSFKAGANVSRLVSGTGTISVGSDALNVSSDVAASGLFRDGAYAYIGSPAGVGQLFRIVSVSGSSAVVRPKARAAFSGQPLSVGAVRAPFRLAGETPRIPLTVTKSLPFSVELEEVY